MGNLQNYKDKDLEGKNIQFDLIGKLGCRSTNRIDELATDETKTYIAKQTFADKSIPSSDKKQVKYILQNGVSKNEAGKGSKKVIHKFELK